MFEQADGEGSACFVCGRVHAHSAARRFAISGWLTTCGLRVVDEMLVLYDNLCSCGLEWPILGTGIGSVVLARQERRDPVP